MDKVIEKLREINEPVPRPSRLPDAEEVRQIEQELGVTFHPDFAKYLLKASDVNYGYIEPVTITNSSSHTYLLSVAKGAWEMGVPENLMPIAEANGDYYCIDEGGKVLFWSHDGATDEAWPNLESWIQMVWINGD